MDALKCAQYCYLADNSADFVTETEHVQEAFFIALKYGMAKQYTVLINNGAQVNSSDNDQTTLDIATSSGNVEIVLDLVTKLQVLANSDAPVLPYIAQFASTETLELVTTHNPRLLQEQDEMGCNALHSALLNKNFDAALWLINYGIEVNTLNEMGTPIVQFAQMHEAPKDVMVAIIKQTNVETLAKNVALHQASNPARYSTLHSEEEIAEGIIEFIKSTQGEYALDALCDDLDMDAEYESSTMLEMDDILPPTAAGGAYAAGSEALISTDLAGDSGILDTDIEL